MLPLLGGLITGGMGLIGSMFSSNTAAQNTQANIGMQQQTNQMAIEEAQKNRDFTEQMSSTAYQRARNDMQSAGLNPAMMFGSAGAASTPGGTQPSLGTAKSENVSSMAGLGDAAAKAVSSAVQFKTMDKMTDEMANLEVENRRLSEAVDLVHSQTATEKARRDLVKSETAYRDQSTTEKKLDRARQEWEAIKYLDLSGIPDVLRKLGNIGSWAGDKASDTISPLLSSAKGLKALLPSRSSSQRSRVDSKGNSFDEFWENRSGMSWR